MYVLIDIPFMNYHDVEYKFYTIDETCELLNIDKSMLKEACEEFNIDPQENENGVYGFTRQRVCNLHNHLYKKYHVKNTTKKKGPWD